GAPAFRFGVPPAQAVPGPATFVADPQRDTTLPPTVTASYAAQFDITGIEIEGSSPTTTRVVLGVADLGQVLVPLGYDAVFYVVGFRTDFGDVMVGYHKNSQNRGSSQEFFCSQDVAAFAQTPTDPMEIVRVPIEGMIAIASGGSDRARATGGGAGAIQFTVPHECFDPDLEGPFEASAVAAGTFLVQNPAGQGLAVQRVDAAAADGPVTLGALAPSPGDGPSWLSRPFGVENFWDMFGIAAAVATSAVGIGIVQRRRGILKKYLAAIDAAVAENADGGAREAALRQIRADLKRDLVRGAISEGHFVIVERRLDEHLSKARLAALTDAFDDLPHTLLQKLQELLSDGEMRKDEYRLFCTHLERTRLTEDAKEDIRRRVALWVVEDAAVGTGDAGAKA
ncbi:MAG TPA: hypothetical protein VI997_04885, partial [Candidatus Thermoplasmatota archaeon]|nr:hypothetical protein [Candidatus Thermoplasmatota archaeon]